jgi:hypothetical protein
MQQRYRPLRTIGTIFRILGYICLVLTIITVIGICGGSVLFGTAIESNLQQYGGNTTGLGVVGGAFWGVFLSLGAIIYGGIASLSLIAIGEGIYLLISIEENTRKTAYLVENQNKITPSESLP